MEELEEQFDRLAQDKEGLKEERRRTARQIRVLREKHQLLGKRTRKIEECGRSLEEDEALVVEASTPTRIINAQRRTKDALGELQTWLHRSKDTDERLLLESSGEDTEDDEEKQHQSKAKLPPQAQANPQVEQALPPAHITGEVSIV